MSTETLTYNLKDFEIFNNSRSFDHSVWIPDKTYIVIGRSNNAENSVNLNSAIEDNIRILKRPSGGEAVILSQKTVVISVKLKSSDLLNTHKYFKLINNEIINTLKEEGVNDLRMNGISDISIGDKKILGSSIYRKSDVVFYHAVLNISESIDLIEKYLRHPKREPDYRKGRSHKKFVTSVKTEGYKLNTKSFSKKLNENLLNLSEL